MYKTFDWHHFHNFTVFFFALNSFCQEDSAIPAKIAIASVDNAVIQLAKYSDGKNTQNKTK